MQSAGEILRQKRLELKLTFTQVNEQTKISWENIRALEKSRFDQLPGLPFVKGMVQNYAKTVGLDPAKLVAVLKRDYKKRQQKKFLPAGMTRPLDQPSIIDWLQRPLVLAAAALILLISLVGFSWWKLYQPPRLDISAPQSGQTLFNPVQVVGRTDRDATLTLNDKTVNLEPDGRFETSFSGEIGTNRLEFKAESRRQKIKTEIIEIIITQ